MMDGAGADGYWLYLGYTGAPALAQIGWLQRLHDRSVPVAGVVGTGLGALVGALWACESDLARVGGVLAHLSWSPDSNFEWLDILTKGRTFEELARPLVVVALDLRSGDRAPIRTGSVARAVRCAMGLSGWIPPLTLTSGIWGDAGPLDCNEIRAASGQTAPRMAAIRIEQDVYQGAAAGAELAVMRAQHEYRRGAGTRGPAVTCDMGPLDFARIPEACAALYGELAAYPPD